MWGVRATLVPVVIRALDVVTHKLKVALADSRYNI